MLTLNQMIVQVIYLCYVFDSIQRTNSFGTFSPWMAKRKPENNQNFGTYVSRLHPHNQGLWASIVNESQDVPKEEEAKEKNKKKNHMKKETLLPPDPSTFPDWAYEPRDFFRYELLYESKKSMARVGRIHAPHGVIDTPGFVAVATNGALKVCCSKTSLFFFSGPNFLTSLSHFWIIDLIGGVSSFLT